MEEKTAQKAQENEKIVTGTPPAVVTGFMPRKTLVLIVGLTLVTILLLILALGPSLKFPAKTTPKPVVVSPAHTILTIAQPIATGSAWSSDINISTDSNKVTAVDLEITYNPLALTNVDINLGKFFNNPAILLKKIDPVKGTISYILGINLGQKAISGKGTVATMTFSPVIGKVKQTLIEFGPKTAVAAQGEIVSVLKTTVIPSFWLSLPTPTVTPAK